MDTSSRPVFIIGCPRSGTTWLYHLLLSAGRFAIYRSETQIYTRFGPCFGNFTSRRRRADFLRQWLTSEYFLRSGLDASTFYLKAMESGHSAGAMLRLFMEEICCSQHAARWAECTPENGLHLRRISLDFPEALFIHIVRDGRDVALSLARTGFIKPFPWHRKKPERAAAAYWDWFVNAIGRESNALRDAVLTVTYEEMVNDLEGALQRISPFIGQALDLDRVMRHRIGSVASPNSSFSDMPSAGSVRWRSVYSEQLLDELEPGIARTLAKFGYPVTFCRRRRDVHGTIYAARYRASLALRARTILGRFADHGLSTFPSAKASGDPTLRPGDNVTRIRNIVSD